MAETTLTPPRRGPAALRARSEALATRRSVSWPWMILVTLAGITLGGFLAYPTYPNYDSYYSLLWGREILHGSLPAFDVYRAPTEHPLAVAFGALLALAGTHADLLMVAATHACFVALAAGMYQLGKASFGSLVGVVAAALLCTRLDFPFLSARAYVDVPYLALVVWAGALEAQRPRRGTPVFLLLAAAGLLRPDAWLLGGLYFLWCAPPAAWSQRARYAALTALAPLLWCAVDLIVTGNPLFSLTHTSGLAEELGRAKSLADVPDATVRFLKGLTKLPVLAAAIPGAYLGLRLARRRAAVPSALFLTGVGTFWLIALAGLSVIFRYLLISALMVMIFAAVLVGGWTMLPRGSHTRRRWSIAAGVIAVLGGGYTALHLNPSRIGDELQFRGDSQRALAALLHDPKVEAAMRCGPVSVPNHKLVPKVRWVLDAGPREVVARSDRTERRRLRRGGVALYAANPTTLLREGYPPDSPMLAVPVRGFQRLATNGFYAAYGRC